MDSRYAACNVPPKKTKDAVKAFRIPGMKKLGKDTSVFRSDPMAADTPEETSVVQEAKANGCTIALGGTDTLLRRGRISHR